MKKIIFLAIMLGCAQLYAQTSTEVFLLDMAITDGKIILTNLRNISNNDGYDNQPSFYDNNTLLFSSTRNGQTDILSYTIDTGEKYWISETKGGSDYSPLRVPNSNYISAVLLDTTGLQRLYKYSPANGLANVILKDQKVGYHLWYSEDIVVTTILVDNRMDLVVSNVKENIHRTLVKNVGRSLQKISNSDRISFIDKSDNGTQLKSLHPISGEIKLIANLNENIQDLTWFLGDILFASKSSIFKLNGENTSADADFVKNFLENKLFNLSRIAVSEDGKHLAIVAEDSEKLVQKQVDAFNTEDLDTFASCYTDNVVVKNYPNEILYAGNTTLKSNYKKYFENNPKTKAFVENRIISENYIIDLEQIKRSGKLNRQVAIYKIENGKIATMTFLHEKEKEKEKKSDIERILRAQEKAFKTMNVDAIFANHAEDFSVYNYPDSLISSALSGQKKALKNFFEENPDLTSKEKNRIIIGNKVILEEFVASGHNSYTTISIFEIENGKVASVTYVK